MFYDLKLDQVVVPDLARNTSRRLLAEKVARFDLVQVYNYPPIAAPDEHAPRWVIELRYLVRVLKGEGHPLAGPPLQLGCRLARHRHHAVVVGQVREAIKRQARRWGRQRLPLGVGR